MVKPMSVQFIALPSDQVRALQAGAPDSNGQTPERHISDGDGVPCRHCLTDVAKGEAYLILAHRPFDTVQPYAEQGPIFIHADHCPTFGTQPRLPPVLAARRKMLIRGYGSDDRIVYGTGKIVGTAAIIAEAEKMFDNATVAYIHVRSASNNCYQCRIERDRFVSLSDTTPPNA